MRDTKLAGRDPALEARARALYDERLPYHNFDHILDTLASAEVILERCAAEHIRIDATVVYYALLFHDAGYQEDHLALGHASKEAYSAALAADVLEEFGVASNQVRKTVAAILATERDGSFVSAEQKAVRAADLSGMAAEWPVFLRHSLNLKREYELLHDCELSWAAWQQNSEQVLSFYLTQEIRLTSYFHNERRESAFHTAVRDNLRRLLAEPEQPGAA
ncbi:MAG: hypothetical protein H6977_12170 [Gammaproteobacteria bacterium]|nr:hypothetical protein [Gammaproteobacteria bacterium]MCP5200762.1 hypothetical protein [Gammaproteobacteria bacterium]